MKHEDRLRKYLGKPDLPKPVKKQRGRPRKLDPKNKGLNDGEKRFSFIAKIDQIEKVKAIALQRRITIKEVFAEALNKYLK